MYAVTRQRYWDVENDKAYMVEIVDGGLDYANPDASVPKYSGEMKEYDDPRQAAEVAIQIAKDWQKDNPELKIHIAIGTTYGFTLPLNPQTIEEVKQEAQKIYEELPKCEYCGEICENKDNYVTDYGQFFTACSDGCADSYIEKLEQDKEEGYLV